MRALRRARALLASNWGRRDGWHVELYGRRVAVLDDPLPIDMFWVSYAIAAPTGETRSLILDVDLWRRNAFVFRNRRTGEVAPHAFCGGIPPFVHEGRIAMRALYLCETSALERAWIRVLSALAHARRWAYDRLRWAGFGDRC